MPKITLHEEIQDILRDNNSDWMTTHEIADLVNKRGRYHKKDGSAVTDSQIHDCTKTILICLNGRGIELD